MQRPSPSRFRCRRPHRHARGRFHPPQRGDRLPRRHRRVPMESRVGQTIIRFARENVRFLLRYDPKLIVVRLQHRLGRCPCRSASRTSPSPSSASSVPSGRAAALRSRSGRIAVLGTEATVGSGAYVEAIHRAQPRLVVSKRPVRSSSRSSRRVGSIPALSSPSSWRVSRPRQALRTRRHRPRLHALSPPGRRGRSSARPRRPGRRFARATAEAVAAELNAVGLLRTAPGRGYRFLVTDNPERFERIGSHFWTGQVRDVEFVDAESFFQAVGDLV